MPGENWMYTNQVKFIYLDVIKFSVLHCTCITNLHNKSPHLGRKYFLSADMFHIILNYNILVTWMIALPEFICQWYVVTGLIFI